MEFVTIKSPFDGLELKAAVSHPHCKSKGIVQFSHGMAEHKERYYDFMDFLSAHGYICIIHDHRGHGGSVLNDSDRGYFYTEDIAGIVEDLFAVTQYIKKVYPGLPVYMFSHSMGTLVARNYLKKYDDQIAKLVLCGPPTENSAAKIGLFLAKLSKPFYKEKEPNQMLNRIAFKGFNRDYSIPNSWLSENPENVAKYNSDPLCGFIFTTNGFINLMKLQIEAFNAKNWFAFNFQLQILVMAGKDDPVIISEDHFKLLLAFLNHVGYKQISSKLYENKRHEILNERYNMDIYQDILTFFDKQQPISRYHQ